jgi:Zn-dependent protease with chaperone function
MKDRGIYFNYISVLVVMAILLGLVIFTPPTHQNRASQIVYDRYGAVYATETRTIKEPMTSNNPMIQELIRVLLDNNIIVYRIHENTINAYTNGKDIYVYDGLTKQLSPEALTIVILHEVGHIVNQHVEKTIVLYEDYMKECQLTHSEDLCLHLLNIDPDMLEYSRKCEYEADMFAFRVYRDAGLPISACKELFTLLGSNDRTPHETTHPASYKRQAQCIEYVAQGIELYTPTYETRLTVPAGI